MTTPARAPLRLLTVGFPQTALQEKLAAELSASSANWEVTNAATIAESLQRPPDFPVDVLLVWQSFPDEYPAAEVEELLDRYPLCHVLCCYGPWCEADGRTRRTWPAAVRWPEWLVAARLEVIAANPAAPPLPLTATRDDMFAAFLDCSAAVERVSADVLISDPDLRLTWENWQKGWNASPEGAVVDLDAEPDLVAQQLSTVEPGAPVLGLTAWWPDQPLILPDSVQPREICVRSKLTPLGARFPIDDESLPC